MTFLPSFESICMFLLSEVLLVLSIQEIHADQEKIVKISAAGQLMRCSAPIDILFLLDGSYSIGKGSFERSKHFTGELCDALDIRPDRVRVGMVQFSSIPHLELPLDLYATKQEVKERIKKAVFRGGGTETGLALKYVLHKGFPGGRNSTVPEILIILSDGKSQGNTELPAMQLKERRITGFAVGIKFPRWEQLHALASEPAEQHVLFAGDAADAANGFYSTLTRSMACSSPSPDCKIESHPCERKTLETVKELAGNYICWRGSKQQNATLVTPSHARTGGTCVSEGLDKFYCLCPVGYGGNIHCAPKLSIECGVDLLFLMERLYSAVTSLPSPESALTPFPVPASHKLSFPVLSLILYQVPGAQPKRGSVEIQRSALYDVDLNFSQTALKTIPALVMHPLLYAISLPDFPFSDCSEH